MKYWMPLKNTWKNNLFTTRATYDMNRPIKFRAIVNVNSDKPKELRYYDLSRIDDLNRLAAEDWAIDQLMQFTGLTDRNGKEIWEGDIVKVTAPDFDETTKTIVIEFKDGAYTIEWDGMFYDGADMTTIHWAMELDFQFEVIGDIYSTPELLNK